MTGLSMSLPACIKSYMGLHYSEARQTISIYRENRERSYIYKSTRNHEIYPWTHQLIFDIVDCRAYFSPLICAILAFATTISMRYDLAV